MITADRFIKVGKSEYYVMFEYSEKKIDDTFSYDGGVRHCCHFEVDDIELMDVWLQTPDGQQLEVNINNMNDSVKHAIIEDIRGMKI